jgi:hypothetical protein
MLLKLSPAGGVSQATEYLASAKPEFKPSYHQKKKKKNSLNLFGKEFLAQ